MTTIKFFAGVFFGFLFLTGFYSAFIFGHEFGHVALNDFRWTRKFCVTDCEKLTSEDYKFNQGVVPLVGVELEKPFNSLATNETACDLVGLSFGLTFFALSVFFVFFVYKP